MESNRKTAIIAGVLFLTVLVDRSVWTCCWCLRVGNGLWSDRVRSVERQVWPQAAHCPGDPIDGDAVRRADLGITLPADAAGCSRGGIGLGPDFASLELVLSRYHG